MEDSGWLSPLLWLLLGVSFVSAQWNTNALPSRSTAVHLFEWKWPDIAAECENFLSPKGYAAVQVSPPNEYLAVTTKNRPWWERYQPVSYRIISRSGDEEAFTNMVRRCNAVGVRIYVDAVINHMSGDPGGMRGVGGSRPSGYDYPDVPYNQSHFHPPCIVDNYQDVENVRNCQLVGLRDLDHGLHYVRKKITDFMNNLIDLGVAGFRIDAAKHMWPNDLSKIYAKLKNLSSEYFPSGSRPFIYQEVIGDGGQGVKASEYVGLGRVCEFKYGQELGNCFSGKNPIKWLRSFGEPWGLLPGNNAVVFVDNHDNQRSHGGGGEIITFRTPKRYKMVNAFMLAWPYGFPRVMSSYEFSSFDQGPPQDSSNNITSPVINADDSCTRPWVCEHRWRQIYNMVGFRNVAGVTAVANWWDNGNYQIAFSRGNVSFIAINAEENTDLRTTLHTGLAAGTYCDVISGKVDGEGCSGKTVTVGADGTAYIEILTGEEDGVLAIHSEAKIERKLPLAQKRQK